MELKRPRSGQFTDQQVQQAFSQLLEKDQEKFLQLHEGCRAFETKLLRIYKANAFGSGLGGCHICLNISKLNHSCVPNAELSEGEGDDAAVDIVAVKEIKKGEEVFISKYSPKEYLSTRSTYCS